MTARPCGSFPSACPVLLLALSLALAACGSGGGPAAPRASPRSPAASLPLLGDEDVHLYVQEAYEGFAPEVLAAVAARRDELVGAGMDCARHLFDWSELQSAPGVFDVDAVRGALAAREASGTPHQFVNITVVDSFGPEALPPSVAALLAAGVAWDDARIVGSFRDLLTALVPEMLDRGLYMIGFANEPGGYYESEPAQAASFTRFVRQAVAHTRTLSDRLATTIVFAGPADPSIPQLMPLIDVATFNGYAYEAELEPGCEIEGTALAFYRSVGGDAIGPLLDEMIDAADGRLVCIQELGQSTGWDDLPETLGPDAGLATQRGVVAALEAALLERRAHFRTVCLWTLNDHTRAGMQYLGDAITAEGLPACYAENLMEIFGPTGLVRSDAAASPKPAFATFKTAIGTLHSSGAAVPPSR